MTPTCLRMAYRSTQKHKHNNNNNDILSTDSTGDWWRTFFFGLAVFFRKTWLLWILSSLLLKRTNIFEYWAFLSSHLTYGNSIPIIPISSLTEKLNQKLYGYHKISLTLSLIQASTCINSFNKRIIAFQFALLPKRNHQNCSQTVRWSFEDSWQPSPLDSSPRCTFSLHL